MWIDLAMAALCVVVAAVQSAGVLAAFTQASSAACAVHSVLELLVPFVVILLSAAAWCPTYRLIYYDNGSCDDDFYARWSEFCVNRQELRMARASQRRKWRLRYRRLRRKWLHNVCRLPCDILFRRRTAAAHNRTAGCSASCGA